MPPRVGLRRGPLRLARRGARRDGWAAESAAYLGDGFRVRGGRTYFLNELIQASVASNSKYYFLEGSTLTTSFNNHWEMGDILGSFFGQ